MLPALLVVLACAGPVGAAAGPSLHGDRIAEPIEAPDLSRVVSMDGSPRRRDALLGGPTALWFFPSAGTPG